MFTTCPKCSLKLVVTAADLRVAQGYVRCGRCSNVFNALAGLLDEQQAALAREQSASADREPPARASSPPQPATTQHPPTTPRPATTQQPATTQRPSAERPARADSDQPIPDAALEFDPATTDVSEVFVQPTDDDPTGTFESIVLGSEDIEDIEELGEASETHELEIDLEAVVAITSPVPPSDVAKQPPPAPSAPASNEPPPHDLRLHETPPPKPAARESAPQPDVAPVAASESPPAPSRPSRPLPEPRSGLEARAAAFADELAPAPHEQAAPVEDESAGLSHPLVERGLKIGSIVLAVILALQIVNHERAELVGIAWLRTPLTAIYSGLGVPIAPHWNVQAYEVRQLGAVAGPRDPGALTVRASVKNTAAREQPLPLLRVTMQDRFGNRIAARDVPPSAYLPTGSASDADLAAGQRVDAEIAFADPGPNAVGFEIDACLKLASGHVVCANDAGPER